MGKFFNDDEEDKTLIPPDYTGAKVNPVEGEDNDGDEEVSDVDEGKIEAELDSQSQDDYNSRLLKTTSEIPSASETPSVMENSYKKSIGMSQFTGGTSWNSGGNNWGPGGFSGGFSGGNNWGKPAQSSSNNDFWNKKSSGISVNVPSEFEINRNKRVIICDFLDCLVETYSSGGVAGLIPRDIYDLTPRFQVWERLRAFNIERVYAMIPKNLIRDTNGVEGWCAALNYFCCGLSSFLKVPYTNCQILAQSQIGQRKEELIASVVNNINCPIPKELVLYIGIYSGLNNSQSDMDYMAAKNVGVDYLDLNILLNSK